MRARHLTLAAPALALLLLAAPAEAALPKAKATETRPCPNNPKKKARVWATEKLFALDNPCSDWLVLRHRAGGEASDSTEQAVNLAGYSKVNLDGDYDLTTRRWSWSFQKGPGYCQFQGGVQTYYGDGHKLRLQGSGLECP